MREFVIIYFFIVILLIGCTKEDRLDCSPLQYGFDISKCSEWTICAPTLETIKELDNVECKHFDSQEMQGFCDTFDPLSRTCDHNDGWTYHLDCTNFTDGFIVC